MATTVSLTHLLKKYLKESKTDNRARTINMLLSSISLIWEEASIDTLVSEMSKTASTPKECLFLSQYYLHTSNEPLALSYAIKAGEELNFQDPLQSTLTSFIAQKFTKETGPVPSQQKPLFRSYLAYLCGLPGPLLSSAPCPTGKIVETPTEQRWEALLLAAHRADPESVLEIKNLVLRLPPFHSSSPSPLKDRLVYFIKDSEVFLNLFALLSSPFISLPPSDKLRLEESVHEDLAAEERVNFMFSVALLIASALKTSKNKLFTDFASKFPLFVQLREEEAKGLKFSSAEKARFNKIFVKLLSLLIARGVSGPRVQKSVLATLLEFPSSDSAFLSAVYSSTLFSLESSLGPLGKNTLIHQGRRVLETKEGLSVRDLEVFEKFAAVLSGKLANYCKQIHFNTRTVVDTALLTRVKFVADFHPPAEVMATVGCSLMGAGSADTYPFFSWEDIFSRKKNWNLFVPCAALGNFFRNTLVGPYRFLKFVHPDSSANKEECALSDTELAGVLQRAFGKEGTRDGVNVSEKIDEAVADKEKEGAVVDLPVSLFDSGAEERFGEGGVLMAAGIVGFGRVVDKETFMTISVLERSVLEGSKVVRYGALVGLGLLFSRNGFGEAASECALSKMFRSSRRRAAAKVRHVLQAPHFELGDAAGLALGLMSQSEDFGESRRLLAGLVRDSPHKNVRRGCALGLAVMEFQQEEFSEDCRQFLEANDAALREYGFLRLAFAFAGTSTANHGMFFDLVAKIVPTEADESVLYLVAAMSSLVFLKQPEVYGLLFDLESVKTHYSAKYKMGVVIGASVSALASEDTGFIDKVLEIVPKLLEGERRIVQMAACIGLGLLSTRFEAALEHLTGRLFGKSLGEAMRIGVVLGYSIANAMGANSYLFKPGETRFSSCLSLLFLVYGLSWFPYLPMVSLGFEANSTTALQTKTEKGKSSLLLPKYFTRKQVEKCSRSFLSEPEYETGGRKLFFRANDVLLKDVLSNPMSKEIGDLKEDKEKDPTGLPIESVVVVESEGSGGEGCLDIFDEIKKYEEYELS